MPEIIPASQAFLFIGLNMKTIHLTETTRKILIDSETLINQIEGLRVITEPEKKLNAFLTDIAKTVVSDLLIIQDLLINGNEVNDFDLMDLIGDYIESIN